MSHCALQEWCLKETIYENLLCKNIEIIYHKMMIAWSIPPDELFREDKYIELYKRRTETGWTDRNVHGFEPQIWKPTLQDIEDDILSGFLHAEFKGKLVEILNNENWPSQGSVTCDGVVGG